MRPRIFERNGLRVAVLAYCDLFIEGNTPREDAPGVATGDPDALLASVRSARASADAVVLLVHWGVEYRATPTEAQRELARRAVEAGATVVCGAHPHVLQPVERQVGDDVLARLLTFPNMLITSHQAFFTREAVEQIAVTTLRSINDFERGRPLTNHVTAQKVKG